MNSSKYGFSFENSHLHYCSGNLNYCFIEGSPGYNLTGIGKKIVWDIQHRRPDKVLVYPRETLMRMPTLNLYTYNKYIRKFKVSVASIIVVLAKKLPVFIKLTTL